MEAEGQLAREKPNWFRKKGSRKRAPILCSGALSVCNRKSQIENLAEVPGAVKQIVLDTLSLAGFEVSPTGRF